MQDERWEFDLDLPRSEASDPLRRPEVERTWRDQDRYLDSLLRIWLRPSGLVRR
jgi:hypothetical protein